MRVLPSLGAMAVCLVGLDPLVAQSLVTGRAFQRQGSGVVPVSHVRVEARSKATGKVLGSVVADDYGSYALGGLPSGEAVVTVSHPRFHAANRGRHEQGALLLCPERGRCGVLDFEMAPNGKLAVRVVDVLDRPIEDITVTVSALGEPDALNKPRILRDGRDLLHFVLPPGRYLVHAAPAKRLHGVAYEAASKEIEFEHGRQNKTVEVILPSSRKYRVSGRVFGLEPTNARRMMITLALISAGHETDETLRYGAPLDRSGYFALGGIPRGSYNVELTWLPEVLTPENHGHLLQMITVDEDLRGLLLAAPSTATSP